MIRRLWQKYLQLILYVFFGGCTTLVNIFVYHACAQWLGMGTLLANGLAWVLSVIFAYVTNRIWVFHSRERTVRGILREAGSFVGARVLTGLLDEGIMYLFIDVVGLPGLPVKIVSNVIVIVLNYVFSKLIVFRKKGETHEK